MRRGRMFRSGRTRPADGQSNNSEILSRIQSLADYTIDTLESSFQKRHVALGPGGEPTRDPTAARKGALLPFGGYKGFGLALMMQALGVLAGAGVDAESEYGYLFVAFRPDLVAPADVFERQMTELIGRIKATHRQPGVDEIRIPSER